ncbi:MAG: Uma2 family endonuclease [Saprospiraceae bacterium]|jgi:Uma2 family endonuclease
MTDDKSNIANEPLAEYGKVYTYADYLKFEYDEMVELIRGKIFRMSAAPKAYHQEISSNLNILIGNFLWKKECKIFPAPFDVVLPVRNEKKDSATTVIQPDLCVICDHTKLDEAGCFGPPDWIIEILSDSTSKKDLNDKYDVYEESGVKEYWIVMPKERLVEVFVLQDGNYQRIRTYTQDESVSPHTFPELKILLLDVFPVVVG